MSASSWGTLAILVSVALSAVIFFRLKDDNSRYFTSMAVLLANMFLFSVRMHERYLFPALVLMLAAFLVKPTKQLFFTYVGFSAIHFLNVGHVLCGFVPGQGYHRGLAGPSAQVAWLQSNDAEGRSVSERRPRYHEPVPAW